MAIEYSVFIGPYLLVDSFVIKKKTTGVACKNSDPHCNANHLQTFCPTCGHKVELEEVSVPTLVAQGSTALNHFLDVLGEDEATESLYYACISDKIIIYDMNDDSGVDIDPKYHPKMFKIPSSDGIKNAIETFQDSVQDITNYLDETGSTYHFEYGAIPVSM